MSKFQAVIFDLDGTLVEEVSSWYTVHKALGTDLESRPNLDSYNRREIDYEEFMRRDISLWLSKKDQIVVDEIDRILQTYRLVSDAERICKVLIKQKMSLFIVTAGIDLLAKKVALRLCVDNYLANGLETDQDGFLTGKGVFRVDLARKEIATEKMLGSHGFTLQQCVAIGDTRYDISLLKACGLGLAVSPKDEELVSQMNGNVLDRLADIEKWI